MRKGKAVEKERADLAAQQAALQQELQQSKTQHQQYREQHQQSQEQLQQCQAQLQQSQVELQQFQAELQQSQGEVQQCLAQLQQSQDELQQARQQLQLSEVELQQVQERAAEPHPATALEAQLQEALQRTFVAEELAADLRNDLSAAVEVIYSLNCCHKASDAARNAQTHSRRPCRLCWARCRLMTSLFQTRQHTAIAVATGKLRPVQATTMARQQLAEAQEAAQEAGRRAQQAEAGLGEARQEVRRLAAAAEAEEAAQQDEVPDTSWSGPIGPLCRQSCRVQGSALQAHGC